MAQKTGPARFTHRQESCLNHAVDDDEDEDDEYDAAVEDDGDDDDDDHRGYSTCIG